MGVKTIISLGEINKIFPTYEFTSLTETDSGIIDTTYIVSSCQESYILKKYERDISQKIKEEIELLDKLKFLKLNIPNFIDSSQDWYLYEKLQGLEPTNIKTYHIQALGRFLAKLHRHTYKKVSLQNVIEKKDIESHLKYTKANFFSYYKKLQFLKIHMPENDGVIHGDIFKDNTIFDGTKIGVFDFIDSASGNFAFDVAVALVGFDTKKHGQYFINIFLNTYNQKAPKKLTKIEVQKSIKLACGFYALKRITNIKSTKTARELLQ